MAHRKPRHVGVSPDPGRRHKTRMGVVQMALSFPVIWATLMSDRGWPRAVDGESGAG